MPKNHKKGGPFGWWGIEPLFKGLLVEIKNNNFWVYNLFSKSIVIKIELFLRPIKTPIDRQLTSHCHLMFFQDGTFWIHLVNYNQIVPSLKKKLTIILLNCCIYLVYYFAHGSLPLPLLHLAVALDVVDLEAEVQCLRDGQKEVVAEATVYHWTVRTAAIDRWPLHERVLLKYKRAERRVFLD